MISVIHNALKQQLLLMMLMVTVTLLVL